MDCTIVLPTFFPGDEIFSNLNSLPSNLKILIIDNSYNDNLRKKIEKFKNCQYYNIGDVGLGKTFNYALDKVKTKYLLLTQPDVVLRKNCLENLIKGIEKYGNCGMAVPIVFDNGIYSKYDFYDLKYSSKNKTFNYHKLKKKINIEPSGDFCVDAVNATTMLLKTEAIKKIGGWDNNIYVYLEDIDISLRLTLSGYSIIKISNAEVDHKGWSSHFLSIKDTMNISRVWHFTWSSIYFNNKFCKKRYVVFFISKIFFLSVIKNFFHVLSLNKIKFSINLIKISACLAFIFNKGSYFRVKHKVDKSI